MKTPFKLLGLWLSNKDRTYVCNTVFQCIIAEASKCLTDRERRDCFRSMVAPYVSSCHPDDLRRVVSEFVNLLTDYEAYNILVELVGSGVVVGNVDELRKVILVK